MAAATPLAVIALPTPWAVTPVLAAALTAGDATNGNSFPCDGLTFLFALNTGANATITISSVPDADAARSADITADTILANAYRIYQLFPINGWRQPDSTVFFKVSNAAVRVAACRIAAGAGFFGAT